jgi:large subunit ribosomal protein L21
MYAIIESGGKQYRVSLGDVVSFERLAGDVGQTVTFDKVLLVGGKPESVLVGTPYVAKATLQAEIVEQTRGEKLLTNKYKRRKGYRRMIGHRQELTRLLVTKLDSGNGQAEQFDSAKRAEALTKASVKFSNRQADRQAKHAAAAPKKAKTEKSKAETTGTTTKKTTKTKTKA